jgi:asparagine synthase (glutamine-hydrolysing)
VSTIAGILHLDGRPASRDDLARLTRSLSHRIGDTDGTWIDGAIGVFVRVLHTTEESVRERQPWHDSRLTVAFDGRLDNRGELLRALDLPVDQGAIAGDAAIVAGAYERWGDECASHLLGAFLFFVGDWLGRRLFPPRDVIGVRPFYYRLDSAQLLWAPEPHALLRYDNRTAEPNEAIVGEFLANAITDKAETLLAGILRLPPAHTLVVDGGGARVRRYWDIDPSRDLRYRDEREYVEHLDALLREAVTARLRAPAPVGVLLSSGLDSSTVLGVARSLHSHDGAALRAYTLAVPAADESPAAREIAAANGVLHHVEVADLARRLPLVEDVRRYLDVPDYPSATVAVPLRARARADGVRVLLTGLAADDWFGGSLFRYADDVRRGALLALARSLRRAFAAPNFDGWYVSLRAAFWPLVTPTAQRNILRCIGRSGVPHWIRPDFARRIDLFDRIRRGAPSSGFPSLARYDVCREGFSGWIAHSLEFHDRLEGPLAVEHRHPYYDRRIVEFAVALPESLRWRDGEAKYLLRRAAAPYTPGFVRQPIGRVDYSPLLVRSMTAHGAARAFAASRLAAAGWVDRSAVSALYAQLAASVSQGAIPDNLWPVWTLFAMELWRTYAIEGEYNRPGS